MKIARYILFLGLLHGVADACTGFLLVYLTFTGSGVTSQQAGLFLLLYNGVAFALQPLFGWGLDLWRHPRRYDRGAAIGMGLIGLALLIAQQIPLMAILVAGSGSALFHVGAGAMAMSERRASHCGAFAAPGVMGQAAGMGLALTSLPLLPAFIVFACLMALALVVTQPPALAIQTASLDSAPSDSSGTEIDTPAQHNTTAQPTQLQGTLLLLLLAIALRSSIWTLWQALSANDKLLVVALPLAAGTGKLLGGFLAERWSATRYAVAALALSGPLLMNTRPAPGVSVQTLLTLLGIALLQSATPGALVALKTTLPRRPAVAAGLGFGLAIALGGLPDLLHWNPSWNPGWNLNWNLQPWVLPISLASALLFYAATMNGAHRKGQPA